MSVYYGRGKAKNYTLDKKLGSGGEGDVYSVSGYPDLVAKIYHDSKLSGGSGGELREKLETMLDQPIAPYANKVLLVAWPQDILFDSGGKFVGYVMPKVESKYHIFAACRPRERQMLYPKYDWRTAITIAYNLALTVDHVHKTGAVIGDFNSNNIMLDQRGHVTLIDTDSFTIENRKTHKVYKCGVGFPEMLAPELQVPDLSRAVFTRQSDCFSLGIHVFNLLMNNCHPFGCVGFHTSRASTSANPVVKNIVNGVCPYVTGGKGKPNADAPDVMMLPAKIRELFDRTFSYDTRTAVRSATINKRPTAAEWKAALMELYRATADPSRSVRCGRDHSHLYLKSYGTCPWCALANKSGRQNPQPQPQPRPKPQTRSAARSHRPAWMIWGQCIWLGVLAALLIAAHLDKLFLALRVDPAIFWPWMHIFRIVVLFMGIFWGCIEAHGRRKKYGSTWTAGTFLKTGVVIAAEVFLPWLLAAILLKVVPIQYFVPVGIATLIPSAIAVICSK